MNTQGKHRYLRLFVLMTVGISGLLYAVAVFIPASTPPVTLGKYAMQSQNLTQTGTKAYRSWFENGAWQGDIIEYDIKTNGDRITTAPVGSNDPAVLLAAANDSNKNWLARAEFLKKETDITDYWKEETSGGRHIITYNSEHTPHQVDFLWDNLSATQKSALDAITLADPDGDPTTTPNNLSPSDSQGDNYFSPILRYIRGDRSLERDKDGGYLRRRYSLLGDITTTPVYIGPPHELYFAFPDYTGFHDDTLNANRVGRVAAPANDGMLHILDAVEGTEVFAYVPSMVIPKLDLLAARNSTYDHTYYLDGELTEGSAQRNGDWNTILTGGGGAGFIGMFALNMTDETATGTKIIFEKNETSNNLAFGHIYGPPTIAPLGTLAAPEWYVFTGNGYRNDADYPLNPPHPTELLMVSLDDPDIVYSIPTGTTGGLSAPTLLDTDSDKIVDTAFAGDIKGNLWMFKINPDGTGTSTLLYSGNSNQPIVNRPALAEEPYNTGNYFVYFGTGSIFSETDALDDAHTQGIYGIQVKKEWIADPNSLTNAINSDNLKLQALASPPLEDPFTGVAESIRYFSNCPDNDPDCQAVDYSSKNGWKLMFPDCGERLVGAPFVRAKRVQFVTTNPTGDLALNVCNTTTALPGNSWLMSLDYLTGGDGDTVVYNLNGNSILDDGDKVSDQLPVGLRLGKGNIAQPVFARLKNGIDKMFINGLILAIPLEAQSGPLLSGHLDVETDSPWNGKTAVNNVSKHSEGYDVNTPDGLGRAVDGHVHAYDTIHGVDYVDLFQLEPRRGLANLAASTPSIGPENDGNCKDTENEKRILVGNRCIEAVEGELNRAYDTYSDPPASEVYDKDSTLADPEMLDPNQKFIVVLANADLSFAGRLQIGCRIWKVKDYQDWITPQLVQDAAAGKLDIGDAVPQWYIENHLVMTLADILSPGSELNSNVTCPTDALTGTVYSATEATNMGLSMTPTLRIGFGKRALLDEGVVGTRSQCVLGLHDYQEPVCYTDRATLTSAKEAVDQYEANPPTLTPADYGCSINAVPDPDLPAPLSYLRDPALQLHVTRVRADEGNGFRWRNGALTMQLLAVGSGNEVDSRGDNTVQFTLQPPESATGIPYLPVKSNVLIGGTHAYAYTVTKEKNVYTVHPDDGAGNDNKGAYESGLLYEASMFWHYSDLADELRTGAPANTPCYGYGTNWKGRISQERGGLTLGEYQCLTDPKFDSSGNPNSQQECIDQASADLLSTYAALLVQIDNAGSEDQLNNLLRQLADLLADHPGLAKYAKYRDYAPGHIPEQHLLPWDKNQDNTDDQNTSSEDGTPLGVTTIENIDTEARGPNERHGRRNWIDLRQ